VIRIRYSTELQPGLNGQAERVGRTTVVYLLPGLTSAQRAAALRRLRQHGRMGISPPLPAGQLLSALLALRIRTAFGQVGAIVRIHPAGSTLPVMVVSGAVAAFMVLSAVSIRVIHQPEAIGGIFGIGPIAGSGASPSASGGPDGHSASSPGQDVGDGNGAGGAGTGSGPGAGSPGSGSGPGVGPGGSRTSGSSGSSGPGGSAQTSTAATTPPGSGTSPAPNPAPTAPGAATTPGPASPPASSAGSTTSVCIGLGSLGICLSL
jgi:hypothetical protein